MQTESLCLWHIGTTMICRESRAFFGKGIKTSQDIRIGTTEISPLPLSTLPVQDMAKYPVRWFYDYMVWADLVTGTYQQTNARLWRQGQRVPWSSTYYCKDTIDEDVMKALRKKENPIGAYRFRKGKNWRCCPLTDPYENLANSIIL